MANYGLKALLFIITAHVFVWGVASTTGALPGQSASPHKAFADQFISTDFTGQGNNTGVIDVTQSTGILSGTIALAAQAINFVAFMVSVIVSPYILMLQSPMPSFFKVLFGSLLAAIEVSAVASFTRGKDY